MRRNRTRTLLMVGSITLTAILSAKLDLPRISKGATAGAGAGADLRGPVIVHLKDKDQQITITSSPFGPLYTVTRDGQTVVDRATLEELKAKDPLAHRQVESATAAGGAGASPKIWAGAE
jgi:hypothetical protein